jgi:hypothetical protein
MSDYFAKMFCYVLGMIIIHLINDIFGFKTITLVEALILMGIWDTNWNLRKKERRKIIEKKITMIVIIISVATTMGLIIDLWRKGVL